MAFSQQSLGLSLLAPIHLAGYAIMAMEVQCLRCGELFNVRAYRAKTAKFCSMACRRSGRIYACYACGDDVYRAASHATGKRVFCSVECAKETRIQPGNTPWNYNLKGIHLSPQSEFKPGHRKTKRQPIGSVSIRTRKRDGTPRAWVKVGQPNKWMLRSQLVWISAKGPIEPGHVIHHIDRDSLNDDISNLACMTKAEHIDEHRHEFSRRGMKKES